MVGSVAQTGITTGLSTRCVRVVAAVENHSSQILFSHVLKSIGAIEFRMVAILCTILAYCDRLAKYDLRLHLAYQSNSYKPKQLHVVKFKHKCDCIDRLGYNETQNCRTSFTIKHQHTHSGSPPYCATRSLASNGTATSYTFSTEEY